MAWGNWGRPCDRYPDTDFVQVFINNGYRPPFQDFDPRGFRPPFYPPFYPDPSRRFIVDVNPAFGFGRFDNFFLGGKDNPNTCRPFGCKRYTPPVTPQIIDDDLRVSLRCRPEDEL